MAHYFDETLHRHAWANTPKSPLSPTGRHLRRSSTARSIGARSDFESGIHDLDGDEPTSAGGAGGGGRRLSRRGSGGWGSFVLDDPERVRERAEADNHLHKYISEQLERVHGAQNEVGPGDEFEAKAEA